VGRGEAGPFRGDATGEQEPATRFLVRRTGSGQLSDVNDLADIVRGGTEQHRAPVIAQSEIAAVSPPCDLAGDIVDEPQVSGQPRRSPQFLQQIHNRARQQPQRRDRFIPQRSAQQAGLSHPASVYATRIPRQASLRLTRRQRTVTSSLGAHRDILVGSALQSPTLCAR
jgi:hypothetical protein